MSWKGMLIGSWLGSLCGGPLGALLGAALGHQAEKLLAGESCPRSDGPGGYSSLSSERRAMIFCASAAAMLAKIAKADGHVSRNEIAAVESAFARLGFTPAARAYAIKVFRKAKDDEHTIYQYAREFAAAVGSTEMCELLYELLWDVAGADGYLEESELRILRQITRALSIRAEWYLYFRDERLGGARADTQKNELAEAYRVLGASETDSSETLRKKYRELAKKNHPDALRAQGLPEEMAAKATERMGRINAAWAMVKEARGI